MSMPGGMEWVIIAIVILLLFGGKKIPELAKGLGTGIKNFKNAVKEDEVVENKTQENISNTQTAQTNTQETSKAEVKNS
ncbi:MAG: twin-arginine translocase TatA/TatE family subunit [Arcobacter butzleri]|jgi:sec-independent protein translocase protein TatA|nr:twin-arginine translocase TatA/TatE family subunit [Arcobacteraceae bacterium]MDY0364821.1 twin-arginine translocase TatA/TatE family subunit [Arcobacteraceae bacterium]NLO17893.1 twin-arginine translocase TatA/TatE family subunit [Aliarcobacter butzleri]